MPGPASYEDCSVDASAAIEEIVPASREQDVVGTVADEPVVAVAREYLADLGGRIDGDRLFGDHGMASRQVHNDVARHRGSVDHRRLAFRDLYGGSRLQLNAIVAAADWRPG